MNRAGGAVVRFCRMTRTKWGLRAPTPRGTFLYGQKGTKKPPGEGPRSPRHRPPGDTPYFVYLPFAEAGQILPMVPALRLPDFCVYPRVLSGGPCCGTSVRCWFPAQRFGAIPVAGSVPLRGRQAELDDRQTTRSEPRRKLSFTGHRSSSLGSVSENPPLFQGVWGDTPSAFLGTFCAYKKYPRGAGARSPRIYEKRPEAYTIVRFRPFL